MAVKKKPLMKAHSKRLVYVVLCFVIIALMINVLLFQNEAFEGANHYADDYLNAGSAVIALLFIGFSWDKKSLKDFLLQDKVIGILFVGAFVVQCMVIAANFPFKASYIPELLTDEAPTLLTMILIYVNRFR